MIEIAVLEDDEVDYDTFLSCLNQYQKLNNMEGETNITHFKDAESFLNNFKCDMFDLVFMDIHLGKMDGLTCSHKLREIDSNVVIIFLTNLAQYAIQGYEVDALDFMVKPLTYYVFEMKFKRALTKLKKSKDVSLQFTIDYEQRYIKISHIKYIEIVGHKMIIHTTDGDFNSYGSLKNIEDNLAKQGIDCFARCNSYLLVNFNFIKGLYGFEVDVDGTRLDISHPKKAKFIKDYNTYLGKGGK